MGMPWPGVSCAPTSDLEKFVFSLAICAHPRVGPYWEGRVGSTSRSVSTVAAGTVPTGVAQTSERPRAHRTDSQRFPGPSEVRELPSGRDAARRY